MAFRLKSNKCGQVRMMIFVVISTLIVLSSGGLTFLWQMHQTQKSHADSASVVGPPTLPAATVDSIFEKAGSPMAGTGSVVEQASRQYNIDDAFALGVWWAETNDGEAGVGLSDLNPGSVRGSVGLPVDADNYTLYPSYSAAITDWFQLISSRYVGEGLTSAYSISNTYVGTAGASAWAGKVVSFMDNYHAEAPPEAQAMLATPVATPASTPQPRHVNIQEVVKAQATVSAEESAITSGQAKARTAQSQHAPSAVAPLPVAASQPQQPVQTQTFLSLLDKTAPIGFVLFAVLALALWGIRTRIRRGAKVATLGTAGVGDWQRQAQAQAYPPLAPLYVNQYSPVLEQQTSSLLAPIATECETGAFAFPGVPQVSRSGVTEHLGHTSERAGQGFSTSSISTITMHKILLLPSNEHESEDEYAPSTENLPNLGGVPLPRRELVGSRPSGLLQRYGNQG
ncbi:MAG TPA: hypothetical protein VHZ51_02900 [Ktedonobacteraceae bacterium]|nr:hypothetical protein [Ktedonobacteraceae bacterium]